MFFIAYTFKELVHVFAGLVKIFRSRSSGLALGTFVFQSSSDVILLLI